MSLSDAAVARLTDQMQGLWSSMTDAQLKGRADWLQKRCPASEQDVSAALLELSEKSDRLVTITQLRNHLLASGAIADVAIPGTGDPRLIAAHKRSIGESAQTISRQRGVTYDEALEMIRITDGENLALDESHGLGSAGTHKDRITAVGELQRERGGRANLNAGTQEALT